MNRAAKRVPLFESPADYGAFENVLIEGLARFRVALYAYCVMPNHWHFVIAPLTDGALSRFMHWVTMTHARRWQTARGMDGHGAVYQGRFKAIPVSTDIHFLCICRYVERNALRAGLVARAEEWQWSSGHRRLADNETSWLARWPVAPPSDWSEHLNAAQPASELHAIRSAVRNGEPYGSSEWRHELIARLGGGEWRKRGRPRRDPTLSSRNDSRPLFTS